MNLFRIAIIMDIAPSVLKKTPPAKEVVMTHHYDKSL